MHAKRIVIVAEDDADIRDGLANILNDEGYETRTARDGAEALSVLESLNGAPCILLLDLMMPGVSGADVLVVLAREHRLSEVPVIVCSAVAGTPKLPIGVRQFISKPLSIETLLDALETIGKQEAARRSDTVLGAHAAADAGDPERRFASAK